MLEVYEKQAETLKALAHPTRYAVLRILEAEEEACVCHINAVLSDLRQSYISQQLTVLRKAGIIQPRKEGWNVHYSVKDPRVFEILDLVEGILGEDTPKELNLKPESCTCEKCEG